MPATGFLSDIIRGKQKGVVWGGGCAGEERERGRERSTQDCCDEQKRSSMERPGFCLGELEAGGSQNSVCSRFYLAVTGSFYYDFVLQFLCLNYQQAVTDLIYNSRSTRKSNNAFFYPPTQKTFLSGAEPCHDLSGSFSKSRSWLLFFMSSFEVVEVIKTNFGIISSSHFGCWRKRLSSSSQASP